MPPGFPLHVFSVRRGRLKQPEERRWQEPQGIQNRCVIDSFGHIRKYNYAGKQEQQPPGNGDRETGTIAVTFMADAFKMAAKSATANRLLTAVGKREEPCRNKTVTMPRQPVSRNRKLLKRLLLGIQKHFMSRKA